MQLNSRHHPIRSATLLALLAVSCRSNADLAEDWLEHGVIQHTWILETTELDPAHEPSIKMLDALATSRTHAPQGQLLCCSFSSLAPQTICHAAYWEGDQFHVVDFDISNGEVICEITAKAAVGDRGAIDLSERVRNAPDPAECVRAALQQTPGAWVRRVELDGESVPLAYVVELVSNGAPSEVRSTGVVR